jgi:hypothetical protein
MKHTPGPWVAHTRGSDAFVRCADGRQFLCGDIIYHPVNIANANLIAAAPDLLAACEAAIACLDHATVSMADADEMLHAAVRKARGHD